MSNVRSETHRVGIADLTNRGKDRFSPFVSIVIPVYNGTKTIRLCLDAIQQLDYPLDKVEVIVVDNNSTDGTPAIVSEYPVRLVYERDLQGPHAATNTGIRHAQGDIIALTDSDCVPDPGWLAALVKPFEDPEVVAVGGRIEAYQPSSPVERFLDRAKPLRNVVRLAEQYPAAIVTANAAYRADTLREVGLFDANMYTGADVDLGWRVQWQTGKRAVYVTTALIYHKFNSNPKTMFRHYRIYGYSEIMLATLYGKMPGYPRPPKEHMRILFKQIKALLTYVVSFILRFIRSKLQRRDNDYVLSPWLWFLAESGNVLGKLQALWETRFFRKVCWRNKPRVI